jgi:hypothetical protein
VRRLNDGDGASLSRSVSAIAPPFILP